MAKPLLSDELWARIEPILPDHAPQVTGRPRVPDRAALTGVLFVLKTGIPWEHLPQEMGCGSGMTCWRRLRDWQLAGAARAAARETERRRGDRLVASGRRLLLRACGFGGFKTGPSPVDRRKAGSKH